MEFWETINEDCALQQLKIMLQPGKTSYPELDPSYTHVWARVRAVGCKSAALIGTHKGQMSLYVYGKRHLLSSSIVCEDFIKLMYQYY